VKKWLDEWFAAKGKIFIGVVSTNCSKDGKNVTSNGAYFE